MLSGMLRAIRSAELRIPQDASVVSSTNPEIAELVTSPVTELRVHGGEIGLDADDGTARMNHQRDPEGDAFPHNTDRARILLIAASAAIRLPNPRTERFVRAYRAATGVSAGKREGKVRSPCQPESRAVREKWAVWCDHSS